MTKVIDHFSGRYFFLSNFFVEEDGMTLEHRFQAAKARNPDDCQRVLEQKTPGQAKWLGRQIPLLDGWDDVRIDVMRTLLLAKFHEPDLAALLIATGDALLIEGNSWGDNFWGTDTKLVHQKSVVGENMLGRLLMEVRDEIRDRVISSENDGTYRAETSLGIFDVEIVNGKVVTDLRRYGLCLTGAPFATLLYVTKKIERLQSDQQVPIIPSTVETSGGNDQVPRGRRQADFDPAGPQPIDTTAIEQQVIAAARGDDNTQERVQPVTQPTDFPKPKVEKITATVKRLVWTEEDDQGGRKGSWELVAHVEAEPDPNHPAGANLDRLHALCKRRVETWMGELGLNG